ncbi:M48 family metallopeptidase [Pseudokordiimonas caeni]|uniref:M48 family metallopeptidase n=1 Tax=Pseudokordiimonas caeni TaxID=2997908 RepID=UPI00281121EE|nr:M48 family metallopeptidase [Pseudokordiimonas caeni]
MRFRFIAPIAALLTIACTETNTITGRDQFLMIPASQDAALGLEAMKEVKQSVKLVKGKPAERVARIGKRIAAMSDRPDMPWEFVVIDEDVLNAWALPGGKIAVYKKMLDMMESDDQLAAVLGHEISHAVLRHGAESLSRAQAQNMAIAGLGMAVGAYTKSGETAQLAATLAGVAAQGFVALPHSRAMELEADDIGTRYMARAGYDPRAAVTLWQKMQKMKEGSGGQPQWLSTHPTDQQRIDRLSAKMGDYLAEYQRAKKS